MACPTSPDGGYHRFKLPGTGLTFEAICSYCGALKQFYPEEEPVYRRYVKGRAPSLKRPGE
jgi:hypothetical protein